MPTLYVMIGIPGSGKSTWTKTQSEIKDFAYVSSDKIIEAEAVAQGLTYSEIFNDYAPIAMQKMAQEAKQARLDNKDVVWDQTNLTAKSRRHALRIFSDYYKIAVVFETPESDELERRLASRPGKVIPEFVIQQMIGRFQLPLEAEGFDETWTIKQQ